MEVCPGDVINKDQYSIQRNIYYILKTTTQVWFGHMFGTLEVTSSFIEQSVSSGDVTRRGGASSSDVTGRGGASRQELASDCL